MSSLENKALKALIDNIIDIDAYDSDFYNHHEIFAKIKARSYEIIEEHSARKKRLGDKENLSKDVK